jgi:hypothetical protein
MAEIGASNPRRISAIVAVECHDPAYVELEIHFQFQGQRVHGEWFSLSEADLAAICIYLSSIRSLEESQ